MRARPKTIFLGLVLLLALAVRSWRLDEPLFLVDEAESTVNALTILQHGYPMNQYLGLPLFENTLIEPWPESPEYEFRDSSYSRRGVAIYHGWLPLYSIAASLKLFGIEPHDTPRELRVRRTDPEIRRMTVAARAPSVMFGMLFLVLLFVMSGELCGPEAAWAALLVGAFSDGAIDYARQARYYSLTALLSTACCYMAWRLARSRRSRDFFVAGVLLSFLFHTHVVAFLIGGAVLGVVALWTMRRPGYPARWLACAVVVLALTLPWIWLTGFMEQAPGIPRAFSHLEFPGDLLTLLGVRKGRSVFLLAGVLASAAAWLGRASLPAKLVEPFDRSRNAVALLVSWMALTYLAFAVLMPTVSYSVERVAMMMCGTIFVLVAVLIATAARALMPRKPQLLAGLQVATYLSVFGSFDPLRVDRARPRSREEVIGFLRDLNLEPSTRLYATPNFHLVLAAYTGLPVQSVAPVRRSFFDSYPGPLLLVEVSPFRSPPAGTVRQAARSAGLDITEDESQRLAWLVMGRAVRERVARRYDHVEVPREPEPLPGFLRPLIDDQPRYTAEWNRGKGSPVWDFPAVFRGFTVRDWSMWWPVFFYRYVGPEDRMGERANYWERFRKGRAIVLPSGIAVYIA